MQQRISVSLPPRLAEPLERVAQRQRWSKSQTAAWLIEKAIAEKFPHLMTEEEKPDGE